MYLSFEKKKNIFKLNNSLRKKDVIQKTNLMMIILKTMMIISGVAYITDKNRGNCSFRKIESGDFDDRSNGPNTVRIRNTKEFFYFDVAKTSTSYEGVVI